MAVMKSNLDTLFKEVLNQFNYSSRLYDNIDQKINSYLFLGSIILTISFGSYFLNLLIRFNPFVNVVYWTGVIFIAISIYGLFSLRGVKFNLLNVSDIKSMILKYPDEDVRMSMVDEYIPIIKQNFSHYRNKDHQLGKWLYLMKFGGLIVFSAIVYILIIVYSMT